MVVECTYYIMMLLVILKMGYLNKWIGNLEKAVVEQLKKNTVEMNNQKEFLLSVHCNTYCVLFENEIIYLFDSHVSNLCATCALK